MPQIGDRSAQRAFVVAQDRAQIADRIGRAGDVITQLRDAVRNDNQPVRAAMMDLRQASRTFKELAREVRQKPSRLLFSSPAPDRKLP